jgi:hypothetical protein
VVNILFGDDCQSRDGEPRDGAVTCRAGERLSGEFPRCTAAVELGGDLPSIADRRQRTNVPDVAGKAEDIGRGGGQRPGDLVDCRRRRELEDRDVVRANLELFDDVCFQIDSASGVNAASACWVARQIFRQNS